MNTTTKLNALENEVREMIVEKLKYFENNYDDYIYGCDLSNIIFEEENINGAFFIDSENFIKKHFEFMGEIYNQISDEFDYDFSNRVAKDLFDYPDRFVCVIILTITNNLINQLDFINNCWDDEIKLDTETVDKIIKELKAL